MTIKLGVVMDPIASIKPKKDTTFAIMLEAQSRGWDVFVMEQKDLWLVNGEVWCNATKVKLKDDVNSWYTSEDSEAHPMAEYDIVLMRKDPPFDTEYIYTTYLLELVEAAGTRVFNKPQSLRDANEKLFAAWFPQCTPPSLVTRDAKRLREFIQQHNDVVLKPLHGMGGGEIFKVNQSDPNISVIIEMLTHNGSSYIMAQKFLPEIKKGDKRIIVIDGEPIPYALSRLPAEGEIRGNLAAGGQGVGVELTDRDRWICEEVGPTLKAKGLVLVGLDVIGDFLTEINVTSPTCVREIDAAFGINISATFLDAIF